MKTVYVLGAGSSASAGAPLMENFRAAAKDVLTKHEGKPPRLKDALDIWDTVAPEENVEGFYVLVDLLARLRRRELNERSVENVKYLISKTLYDRMGLDISEIHKSFYRQVRNGGSFPEVISLNWDVALDRAIAAVHGSAILEYGYSSATLEEEEMPPSDPILPGLPKIKLFKLHGSTNWWFCPNCKKLWYTMSGKAIVSYWERGQPRKCKDCKKKLVPLLIPPTGQKFEPNNFAVPLSEIWGNASDSLSGCDQIAFVGYSFPQADLQFRVFVNEALSRNSSLKTVAIVSMPKFGLGKVNFEDHYASVLTDSRRKGIRFQYFTFDDWVLKENCSLT